MALGSAKVEMTLGDLQEIQSKVDRLEAELALARQMVDEARLGDNGSEARAYCAAFKSAMHVVHFAIAQLHPLTIRGWPFESLRELADQIDERAGLDGFQREVTNDIRLFAAECERWEQARADGREQLLLAEENAARGPATIPT